MSCGVCHRCGSDPVLLWLWHSLAAAAPIQPLAWEFPYAVGAALKTNKQKKRKKNPQKPGSVFSGSAKSRYSVWVVTIIPPHLLNLYFCAWLSSWQMATGTLYPFSGKRISPPHRPSIILRTASHWPRMAIAEPITQRY